jgi:hypothetical protein
VADGGQPVGALGLRCSPSPAPSHARTATAWRGARAWTTVSSWPWPEAAGTFSALVVFIVGPSGLNVPGQYS